MPWTTQQIERVPGAGLGLRTHTALPADTAVLTVPQALFLWKQSAGKGLLREIFSSANLSAWTSLLIQVYYESTHADSAWAPYFAAMPPVFDQPIFWPQELRDRVLAGSVLLERTRTVLAEARDYYDNVFKPFLFEAYPNLFDPSTVSFDHYLWVIGFAWSRAFAVKPPLVSQGDGDYDVICPVACYVNHGATPAVVNAEVTWNVEDENLQIRTTRALDAGTEILISYDDWAPPSDFLGRYGFLPEGNPCDAVEVPPPPEFVDAVGNQATLLERAGVHPGDTAALAVPRTGWDFPLVRGLRALALTPADLTAGDDPAAPFDPFRGPIACEGAVRARLRSLLEAKLAGYPGTLADNEAALAALPTLRPEPSPQLAWEASGLRLRIYERQLLLDRLALVDM